MKLGALEAGGTKMVCAIGDEKGKIYEQVSIPTESPEETIPQLLAFFQDKEIEALGIASFGPVELDEAAPDYGCITTTNKAKWRNYNIRNAFLEGLHCPVGFDTDVNGSVLGEVTFGQAKGKNCVLYLTIGCRTDFADIQNKKECGGNRQWQNHYLRNWAANTKGKGII